MVSYLVDINVWLALTWGGHPYAAASARWFASVPRTGTRLLFCRITQLGLLRLLTNSQVMGDSVLDIGGALGVFDRWAEDPRVEFVHETRGLDAAFRRELAAFARKPATKVVMDAYLASFATARDATLVTFDKALSAIAGRGRTHCVLLSVR